MGQRVRKTVSSSDRYSVHDAAGRWVGDYDHSGNAIQQVVWLGDLPVALLVGSGSGQKIYYIEADALGTPRVVIDPGRDPLSVGGTVVWRWDLEGEAFGAGTPNQDPDGDSTNLVFDMRFPGQRYDAHTGLNYNYFRDYEPGTGRYAQSDPIGLAGGVSTYGYVKGMALTRVDPFGLKTCLLVTRTFVGFADHAALYLERGDYNNGPIIYDPSGSYARSLNRMNADLINGGDATIERFASFYKDLDGTETDMVCQDTTAEEEKRLFEKAELEGGKSGAVCAETISRVLSDSPYFNSVESDTLFRGNLFDDAAGKSRREHFIPNPYLPDPYK